MLKLKIKLTKWMVNLQLDGETEVSNENAVQVDVTKEDEKEEGEVDDETQNKISNDSSATEGYCENGDSHANSHANNHGSDDSHGDSHGVSEKVKKLEELKDNFEDVTGKNKEENQVKDEVEKVEECKYEMGDHILVCGINRKMPAMLGEKLDDEFVYVNFYTKTKEKGWHILEVQHCIKYSEIEKKIKAPNINKISRSRAFLEFTDLNDMSFTESSDTSFDI